MHKAGFVNIIGRPNVGKSTLLNALIGEKLSIITHKPQTTRHRILAIINEEDYQIVFSDTPGIIEDPGYKMQNAMNRSAYSTLEDADVLLFMTEIVDHPSIDPKLAKQISGLDVPVFLILNKIDLVNDIEECKEHIEAWSQLIDFNKVFMISALKEQNTSELLEEITSSLPASPPYYPKDQFTDRSERFFVSEIIREKILLLYHQEIPYSCEIIVESFKEKESKKGPIIHISANIIVSRKTQKSIIIGKKGSAIKQLGTEARKDIEAFLESPVFLELHVKVKEKWRDDERYLKSYGYLH